MGNEGGLVWNEYVGKNHGKSLFVRSYEHCLMGIRGQVSRSTDGHLIHANVDTDVIITESAPYGSTMKPNELYDIIERFCLGPDTICGQDGSRFRMTRKCQAIPITIRCIIV